MVGEERVPFICTYLYSLCLYKYIHSIEIYVGLHFSRKFLLIRHLVNLLLPRLPRAAKRLLTSRSCSFHSPGLQTDNFELKITHKTKAVDILKFWFSPLLFAMYHITLAWFSGNILAGVGRRKSCANLLKPRLPTALGGSACDSVKQFWGISICRQVFPSFVFPCQPVALPYFEQETLMMNFSHIYQECGFQTWQSIFLLVISRWLWLWPHLFWGSQGAWNPVLRDLVRQTWWPAHHRLPLLPTIISGLKRVPVQQHSVCFKGRVKLHSLALTIGSLPSRRLNDLDRADSPTWAGGTHTTDPECAPGELPLSSFPPADQQLQVKQWLGDQVNHSPLMTRMASFTCICLLSLLSLVAGSPAGQHSLEKRQTTVSKSRLAFSNCLFIIRLHLQSSQRNCQN